MQRQRELIAAEPSHQVRRAGARVKRRRYRNKHTVPDCMSVSVIEALETVHVHEQHAERSAVAHRNLILIIRKLLEPSAVRDTRQRIGGRSHRELVILHHQPRRVLRCLQREHAERIIRASKQRAGRNGRTVLQTEERLHDLDALRYFTNQRVRLITAETNPGHTRPICVERHIEGGAGAQLRQGITDANHTDQFDHVRRRVLGSRIVQHAPRELSGQVPRLHQRGANLLVRDVVTRMLKLGQDIVSAGRHPEGSAVIFDPRCHRQHPEVKQQSAEERLFLPSRARASRDRTGSGSHDEAAPPKRVVIESISLMRAQVVDEREPQRERTHAVQPQYDNRIPDSRDLPGLRVKARIRHAQHFRRKRWIVPDGAGQRRNADPRLLNQIQYL